MLRKWLSLPQANTISTESYSQTDFFRKSTQNSIKWYEEVKLSSNVQLWSHGFGDTFSIILSIEKTLP